MNGLIPLPKIYQPNANQFSNNVDILGKLNANWSTTQAVLGCDQVGPVTPLIPYTSLSKF